MARLRTYRFAFAALGALALTAGLAPVAALGQWADPFEDRRARDDVEDDDREAALGGLRGRLDPEQGRVPGRQSRTRAGQDAGDRNPAAGVIFGEPPDPFREPPDPLRDPLTAPDLDWVQPERRAADPNDARQGAEGAEDDPYAALGVRMGSFLLFPELSAESLYDDNLFLSSTNPKGDWALVLTPSLRVQSDWSRHSLTGTVSGVRSYYDRFSTENEKTFSAGFTGRLDIRRSTNLVAAANYSQFLESRSDTDFPSGVTERPMERTRDASLEGNHTFNRVTLTLRGEISQEDYEDGTLIDGSTVNNDDRDFTERRLVGRVAYEFQPGVATFFEGSRNVRDFPQTIDDDGTRNGSSGYDLQGGLSFQLSGKLTGEISAGYTFQTPDDATLSDIDGLILNAALEWQATGLTTVRLNASSDVNETMQAGSAGSIIRSASVSLEHLPRRHITLGASLGYSREEFSGSGNVDEDLELALTGEYNFTRGAALTAAYSHLDSTSSTPNSDYSVNQFRLGVRVRR